MKKTILFSGVVASATIVAVVISILIYNHQNQLSGDYMAIGQNEVDLLAITEGDGGAITGTLYNSSLNGDQLSQNQEGLHGQYNNGFITLSLNGWLNNLFGGDISGQKSGNDITLTLNGTSASQLVFKRVTMNDYSNQVAGLQQQANKALAAEQAQEQAQQQAQAAAAQQEQIQQSKQNAVDNAASNVENDISNLSGDISNMGGDLSSMGGDLSSQGGDVSSAGGDLSSAEADHQDGSDMSGDVTTMQNDIQTQKKDYQNLENQDIGKTLAKDEAQVDADIKQIKSDFATYNQVSKKYSMTASNGVPDVNAAISGAENTLAQYHATEKGYLKQSQQYIATVQGYAAQVEAMEK